MLQRPSLRFVRKTSLFFVVKNCGFHQNRYTNRNPLQKKILKLESSSSVPVGFISLRPKAGASDVTFKQNSGVLDTSIVPSHHGTIVTKKCLPLEELLPQLDFSDHREAYRSKTLPELLRALLIFRFCSYSFLVDHQLKILKWTRRLLGKTLFRKLMKTTVYGQFLAGDNHKEVLMNIERATKYGILPMLAYTAAEGHGATWSSVHGEDVYKTNIEGVKDSFVLGQQCKASLDGNVIPRCTAKLTFLKPHKCLEVSTKLIEYNNNFIIKYFDPSMTSGLSIQEKEICKRLMTVAKKYNNAEHSDIEAVKMNMEFHFAVFEAMENESSYSFAHGEGGLKWIDEIREMADIMTELSQEAVEKGVCIMWDAEQTYIQPAIDVLVLDQMRRFNKDRVVVYSTYQCYLKRAFHVIERDLNIAKREGFGFGAKVVRGAYLDEERALAVKHGYADPVNDDFDATTAMYYKSATLLLDELKANPRGSIHVIFASHNDDTIMFLLKQMHSIGLEPDGDLIWFAQLFGMRDHLAYPLSKASLPAAKLMHYGGVEEGVTYLSRRVMENKHSVNTPCGAQERSMLWKETKNRLFNSAQQSD